MKSRLELQLLFQNIFGIEQIKVVSHMEELQQLLTKKLTEDKDGQ